MDSQPPPSGRTFDPARPDFKPYGFACDVWAKHRMPRANRHNEIELNLIMGGSMTYLHGGRRVTVVSGRVAAFWAATPHQVIDYEGRERYFVATLPLAWFLQAGMPASFVARLLQGDVVAEPDERRAASDLALFAQWSEDLESRDEDRRRVVLLEMEARLLRLGATAARLGVPLRGRDGRVSRDAANKVEAMADFLARHYTERIAVDDVARAVRLHPNYAMTVFRKAFGLTLIEYLTQLRVSHAQRLLVTTDDKILDVALSSGFNSLSRFNEAFVTIAGVAPSRYRSEHRV